MPDFYAPYVARRERARNQPDGITIGHHYKFDIFNVVTDTQLEEMNNKINDKAVKLIVISMALDPREMHLSFRVDDICKLIEKFYLEDFEEHGMLKLKSQF